MACRLRIVLAKLLKPFQPQHLLNPSPKPKTLDPTLNTLNPEPETFLEPSRTLEGARNPVEPISY